MKLQKNVGCSEIMMATSLSKKLLKTIFKWLCLCFLGSLCLGVFAQGDLIRNTQNGLLPSPSENDSSYVAQTLAPEWTATSFINVGPTSINTTSQAKIDAFSDYGVLLDLEEGYINQLIDNQPKRLFLAIPVNNSNFFELQLSKMDITSDDFKITTSSGSTVQIDNDTELFYWGIVKNNPGSIAAVSFYEDEVRCIISDKDGNYVLGDYEDAHVLYADKDINKPFSFDCTTTDEYFGEGELENINTLTNTKLENFINVKPIEVNIECDYNMYLTFGSNKNKVKEYVTALFNESAILFANENIKIHLSEIFIWDTPDPYESIPGVSEMLTDFRINRAGEYAGKVGVLLTDRRNLEGTAFAYTGGLCTTSWSFAAVRIFNTDYVAPVSSYSWDVYTFTHELGHLFGSHHTHTCVWGPGQNMALDNCNPEGTEGGCAEGPTPVNGGTMMSYCVYEEPYINFKKGFGEEPGARIRLYVDQRKCIDDTTLCTIPYNQSVFDENPWLNDVISIEHCNRTEIDVYGNYFHVKSPVGDFIYYNSTFLCEVLLDYCIDHYSQYFPELTASSCGCNEPIPPTDCDNPPICNSDPCLEGGVKILNEDCICVISEPTEEGCDDPNAYNYNPDVNCSNIEDCIYDPPPCSENSQIFVDFPWLDNVVNANNCNGVTINVYDATYYFLIQVITSNSSILYYQTGFEMCTYGENYICHEFYGVSEEDIVDFCSCGDNDNLVGCTDENACNYDPNAANDDGSCIYFSGCTDVDACNFNPDACSNDGSCAYSNDYTGTVFYDICDEGQNYYLILLPDGTILDPYNRYGVNYNYPDGAIVDFGYVERGDTPCEKADKAVTVTCINQAGETCEYEKTGTVIYELCDNDIVYYLIKLSDGSIIDPYNADGVDFDYPEGATVEFSYRPSTITPCYKAEAAVEVICIKEKMPENNCDPNRDIFDDYPFLDDLVNDDNCSTTIISKSGQFILVENAGGQSLYLDSGIFYCDWESCIDFYLPNSAPCVWNCEGLAYKSQNSSGTQTEIIQKEMIEVFPNPSNGKFSLKINNSLEDGHETLVQLFSLEGKLLKTFSYANQFALIDIVEFGKGIYLLSVTTNGNQNVKKIVIN